MILLLRRNIPCQPDDLHLHLNVRELALYLGTKGPAMLVLTKVFPEVARSLFRMILALSIDESCAFDSAFRDLVV